MPKRGTKRRHNSGQPSMGVEDYAVALASVGADQQIAPGTPGMDGDEVVNAQDDMMNPICHRTVPLRIEALV